MNEKTTKQSVLMQMHNGTRMGEAFPEFFGDELPEFGIHKKVEPDKTFKYKGWLCEWNEKESMYYLYTPDELEQPKGFREPDIELGTREYCKQHINNF